MTFEQVCKECLKNDEFVNEFCRLRKIKLPFEDYQKLCSDRTNGRLLTPDGLYFICKSCNFDAEAIGKHFLEILPQIYNKGN